VADKGIIFSAPMVRALLDGRKTQTRRLLSLRGYRGFTEFGPSDTPGFDWHFRRADAAWCDVRDNRLRELLPYAPGDRLYVREAALYWYRTADGQRDKVAAFRADGYEVEPGERWEPSIHMPRWASRLTLTVTDVRVQRVADISEADAQAEGLSRWDIGGEGTRWNWHDGPAVVWPTARTAFEALWNSLHTKPGERWEDNPWIVAVTFSVEHRNIDR